MVFVSLFRWMSVRFLWATTAKCCLRRWGGLALLAALVGGVGAVHAQSLAPQRSPAQVQQAVDASVAEALAAGDSDLALVRLALGGSQPNQPFANRFGVLLGNDLTWYRELFNNSQLSKADRAKAETLVAEYEQNTLRFIQELTDIAKFEQEMKAYFAKKMTAQERQEAIKLLQSPVYRKLLDTKERFAVNMPAVTTFNRQFAEFQKQQRLRLAALTTQAQASVAKP